MARVLKQFTDLPDDVGVKVVVQNRLRSVLTARGIPTLHVARRVGISNRHFYRLIDGLTPRLDIAIATAAVLETPLDDIWPTVLKTVRLR